MRDRLNRLVLQGTKRATAGIWRHEYEGEGFESAEHWQRGHRGYYAREGVTVSDEDQVVCVWFSVVPEPGDR
jgi:uncharacterized protein YhfF